MSTVATKPFPRILNLLERKGALRGADIANLLNVSPATASRWKNGGAFPHPHTQVVLSDLRFVVERLADYYTPKEIRVWLFSKHEMLEGRRPVELISASKTEKVLEVIESLDTGTYL